MLSQDFKTKETDDRQDPCKYRKFFFFSLYNFKIMFYKDTCVTNMVFFYMCSQMMIVFLVKGTMSAVLLRAKCIQ